MRHSMALETVENVPRHGKCHVESWGKFFVLSMRCFVVYVLSLAILDSFKLNLMGNVSVY